MKRKLVYFADRGEVLSLSDLEDILRDAKNLHTWLSGTHPILTIEPARNSPKVGKIRKVEFDA